MDTAPPPLPKGKAPTPLQTRNKRYSLAALLGVILAAGAAAIHVALDLNRPTLLTQIPDQVLQTHPELQTPTQNYSQRGGRYIWGPNDCSVFVSDYILSSGKPLPRRLTTKELADPAIMARSGFVLTDLPPRPGDIVVYRYQNEQGEPRGHTGVLTRYQSRLWVAHNAAGYNGLVLEDFHRFMRTAQAFAKDNPVLRYSRNDATTWLKGLESREQSR